MQIYRRSDAHWRNQIRENSPRFATAVGFADSHGWGEFVIPEPIMFDVTFAERPTVAYGYALDGDALVDKRFPRSFGGVSRWLQDTNDHYIGANVFLVVDTLSPAPIADVPADDPGYDLDHCFTFTGTAIKAFDEDIELFDD